MKTFVELVEEIKKGFDKEDNSVLSNLEDNIEYTSTATVPHAVGTYLVYNKAIYRVTAAIATGDTLTPGTNITVASDIMSLIAAQGSDLSDVEECIAPVESTTSASRAYAIGEKFIKNHALYQAKTAIALGDALVLDTNYELADDITTQLSLLNQTLTNQLTNEVETRAKLGAHNLFDSKRLAQASPSGGITFAVGDDGSLSITGGTTSAYFQPYDSYVAKGVGIPFKPNTSYIFSIGEGKKQENIELKVYYKATSGSNWAVLQSASNVDEMVFTTPASFYDILVRPEVRTGKAIITTILYPLVKLASDTSDKFTPYAKTNQELTTESQTLSQKIDDIEDNQRFNGCFNLCPNNLTSQTFGGVQFTVNANKSITMTPTSSVIGGGINIFEDSNNPIVLERSAILYFGDNTYPASLEIIATYSDDSSVVLNSSANKATLHSGNIKRVRIYFNNTFNQTMTLYPMISYYDGDYVPHAMTNRELTEKIHAIKTANYISKSANSSKTWEVLINEAVTELNSLLATLGSGEYLTIQRVLINGDHVNIPNDYMMNTNTFNRYGSELMVKSDRLQAAELHLASSGSYFHRTDIISSGGTLTYNYTDTGAQVPTSGAVRIDYVIFN